MRLYGETSGFGDEFVPAFFPVGKCDEEITQFIKRSLLSPAIEDLLFFLWQNTAPGAEEWVEAKVEPVIGAVYVPVGKKQMLAVRAEIVGIVLIVHILATCLACVMNDACLRINCHAQPASEKSGAEIYIFKAIDVVFVK